MLSTRRGCESHMKNDTQAEYTQAKSTQTHKVHLVPADAYYRGSWDSTTKVPIIFSYGPQLNTYAKVFIFFALVSDRKLEDVEVATAVV